MVSHQHSKHNPHPHQKPTVDQSQIRPSTSPSYLRIVLDFLLRHLNHPLSSILPTLLHLQTQDSESQTLFGIMTIMNNLICVSIPSGILQPKHSSTTERTSKSSFLKCLIFRPEVNNQLYNKAKISSFL